MAHHHYHNHGHDNKHCESNSQGSSCCCGHHHVHHHNLANEKGLMKYLRQYRKEIISLLTLVAGVVMEHYGGFDAIADKINLSDSLVTLIYYILAVLPVGWDILKETVGTWLKGDFFNEFSLMLLACVGAFIIREYPEAVAILLFYSFGEKLEDSASDKARGRIKTLLDKMPEKVRIKTESKEKEVRSEEVNPGDVVVVKAGERLALDGVLLPQGGNNDAVVDFDTSAITGESVPRGVAAGEEVCSGYIPLDKEIYVRVSRAYSDSTMARIVKMIEDAASHKSHSETMLRRITRWYTPTVMIAAIGVFVIPWIIGMASSYNFSWQEWLERSLVLLVCSCPCALVVSVPLSYFAAIGNASRFGVLFKGSKYLDALRNVDTLLLDKTGTLTTGDFHISSIAAQKDFTEDNVLAYCAALERHSTHPLAQAIAKADTYNLKAADVVVVNHGIKGRVNDKEVMAGSPKMLTDAGIELPATIGDEGASMVGVAIEGEYAGSIFLSDTLKPGIPQLLATLHKKGIKEICVLSGDREASVAATARAAGADNWKSELLPADKHDIIKGLKQQGRTVAFVGDGINDAPALALADVGIAIGTGGTDIAIESADAIIIGNNLNRLADALQLSKKIKKVVAQNVSFAIGVKLLVMILGAFGIATLWAAVFADTGITLLTVIWTIYALRK